MSANAERLLQEAEFFDRCAEEVEKTLKPLNPAVLRRYAAARGLYPKEFCFKLLGDPRGKKVLDVGCGDGGDAVILAKLGAKVVGLDVSPRSIALAKRRAGLDGVADRVSFICAPLGVELPETGFDVIWIDNVLHHVLDELDAVLKSLFRAARPGAQVICAEPMNLNPTLRRIRFLVPVHTEHTPGERPLERHDLAIVERNLPDLHRRHFRFLARLTRFVLPDHQYERASWPQRAACDALALLDSAILALPGLDDLGGMAVLYGRVP